MKHILSKLKSKPILGQSIKVFSAFDPTRDIITSNATETITGTIWSNGQSALTTFFTSSILTSTQRQYYTDIHNLVPTDSSSAVQFSVAYGHRLGSGSSAAGTLNDSPSRAIYSQYARLLLAPGDTQFTTAGSGSTDHIYVINFNRARIKERLAPGSYEIGLQQITSRATNATGSVSIGSGNITLIDDYDPNSATTRGDSGRVFNVVSGSNADGIYLVGGVPVYYGLSYPDYGMVVLDAKMMDQHLGFATNTGSNSEGNNHFTLFHSISGSAASSSIGFTAVNEESIRHTSYFVRVYNNEYNYTSNPTYTSGSLNYITEKSFWTNPKTYITTIGLYNSNYELLAVAKLSKPVLKDNTRESLIKVRLDF